MKDIESIYKVFGNRRAVTVKEITKIHEQREEFFLQDGIQGEAKGEFVLLVEGGNEENKNLSKKDGF